MVSGWVERRRQRARDADDARRWAAAQHARTAPIPPVFAVRTSLGSLLEHVPTQLAPTHDRTTAVDAG